MRSTWEGPCALDSRVKVVLVALLLGRICIGWARGAKQNPQLWEEWFCPPSLCVNILMGLFIYSF